MRGLMEIDGILGALRTKYSVIRFLISALFGWKTVAIPDFFLMIEVEMWNESCQVESEHQQYTPEADSRNSCR